MRFAHLRMRHGLVLAAVVSLAVVACKKTEPAWKRQIFAVTERSRHEVQATLPRSLWQKIVRVLETPEAAAVREAIEAEKKSAAKDRENDHENDHGLTGPLPSVFAPLRVYLYEKNRGILNRGNMKIELSAGGGNVDLSEFVAKKNGTFHMVIEFLPDVEEVERHVFFLSDSVRRKIGRDEVGSGCDTYFDISRGFEKAMRRDGFTVNTSDGRHVSALAGTFFFAAAHEGKLYLAALNVTDSRFKKLLCNRAH